MAATMQLSGFRELERELERLAKPSARKASARRSLKKAAQPMADLMNAGAPRGATGEYARSFVVSAKLTKRQARLHRKMFGSDRAAVEMFVGTSDPAGVQQEFGNIHHGPQPTARPAFDQDISAMLERLKAELWTDIQKAVARAERRAARLAAKG